MLINDRPITLLKFESCRVKTRETRESARSLFPSLYHSLYRFSIPISPQKDIRYRARERYLLSLHTRYISLSITESDSTKSKAVVLLSISFIAGTRDAFSPRIAKTYRAFLDPFENCMTFRGICISCIWSIFLPFTLLTLSDVSISWF